MMQVNWLVLSMRSVVYDMKNETNRLDWIDIARAIGIMEVYLGHSFFEGSTKYILHMIDLPIFFILSGFLWNVQKYQEMGFVPFLKKEIKRLIVPYFKIAAWCFLICGIVNYFVYDGFTSTFIRGQLKYLAGILYSRGTMEWMPQCSPIWFLTCLFCSDIILFLVLKKQRPVLSIIILVFCGWLLSQSNFKLPWNIDTALIVLSYLYVGIFLRKYWNSFNNITIYLLLFMLFIPFMAISIIFQNNAVDFDGNRYDNICLLYLVSIPFVYFLSLTLSYLKINVRGVIIVGQNTLFLMGYNYIFNYLLRSLGVLNPMIIFLLSMTMGILSVIVLENNHKVKNIFI